MISIDKNRLVTNQNLAEKDPSFKSSLLEIGINPLLNNLVVTSGRIIIIDPIYLADIYNLNDEKEQYLKKKGVLLNYFGGDVGGPILRTQEGGIVMQLVFDRVNSDGLPIFSPEISEIAEQEEILFEGIGCDSGSYIFLDYNPFFCELFKKELFENFKNFALINIENGTFLIGYEQWEINEDNPYEAWRRNLVVFPI